MFAFVAPQLNGANVFSFGKGTKFVSLEGRKGTEGQFSLKTTLEFISLCGTFYLRRVPWHAEQLFWGTINTNGSASLHSWCLQMFAWWFIGMNTWLLATVVDVPWQQKYRVQLLQKAYVRTISFRAKKRVQRPSLVWSLGNPSAPFAPRVCHWWWSSKAQIQDFVQGGPDQTMEAWPSFSHNIATFWRQHPGRNLSHWEIPVQHHAGAGWRHNISFGAETKLGRELAVHMERIPCSDIHISTSIFELGNIQGVHIFPSRFYHICI